MEDVMERMDGGWRMYGGEDGGWIEERMERMEDGWRRVMEGSEVEESGGKWRKVEESGGKWRKVEWREVKGSEGK